ncbi:MAG: type IV pilus biogenesis protein PilM [Polyangiaceae bacterium]
MATWLGIDIGTAHVKACVVRSAYRKLAVIRVASAEVVEGDGLVGAVRAAVGQALDGEVSGVDAVAAAVEGSRAAIHRLRLPATAHKQLAEVIPFELGAQVPFDLDDTVFDWRLLDPAQAAREEGQLSIVAAVARVADVRARIELIKEAIGQEPERIGVGALTLGVLVPLVPGLSEGECVAMVDLGAKASDVLVIEHGEPVFARTLSVGTDGLPASAPALARDIRRSLAGHRAQGGAPPSRVYLCGGGAFVSGAQGFLSGELELPVQILSEPAVDLVALGDSARELPRYAKALSLALSLAGRGTGLNLRRGPLAFERGFGWVRERVPVLAGFAAILFVSFVFSGWARIHEAHVARDALTGALASVTREVLGTEATTAEDAQDLLAKEAALSDPDPMPHADAFDVMVSLSNAVPSSVKHDIDELDVQGDRVAVRGIAGSIPEAQSIASALGEERCMRDVKIKSTTQAIGTDRQKYLMELLLACPEDVKVAAKKKGEASSSGSGSAPSSAQSAPGGQ